AVLGDGHTAGNHEVDGIQVGDVHCLRRPRRPLDRRRHPGRIGEGGRVEQEERPLPCQSGHRHIDGLAVLERPLAHGPLWRAVLRGGHRPTATSWPASWARSYHLSARGCRCCPRRRCCCASLVAAVDWESPCPCRPCLCCPSARGAASSPTE